MIIKIPGKKDNVWSILREETLPVMKKFEIARIIPLNSRREVKKFITTYDSIEVFAEKENIRRKFSTEEMTNNYQSFPY